MRPAKYSLGMALVGSPDPPSSRPPGSDSPAEPGPAARSDSTTTRSDSPARSDSTSGRFPERFRPIRELGAGGFGVVFEVEDRKTGERLALKQLEQVDPASIYRFKQEFRVLSDRRHDNLIRLRELYAVDGVYSLTMDLIEGVRFDTYVRGTSGDEHPTDGTGSTDTGSAGTGSTGTGSTGTGSTGAGSTDTGSTGAGSTDTGSTGAGSTDTGRSDSTSGSTASGGMDRTAPGSEPATRLAEANDADRAPSASGALGRADSAPIQRLRRVLPQLIRGVLALHDDGILHRDLKPSNVLVTREGRVVILDFGLALMTDVSESGDGSRAGTPAYMSPEQARGGQLTMASDWYAVGVMIYEALLGHPPFAGTTTDILSAKRSREPRDPRGLQSGLPDDLCELSMALLRRDPHERPNGFAIARQVGLSTSVAASPRHVLEGTFVGRDNESRALHHAFARMKQGRTVVAHVHGSSGLGKTTVVRRFVHDLTLTDEVVVLEGRCFERESVPFKALDDLVDALARYLARLKPLEAAGFMPRDAQALIRLFPSLGRLDFLASVRGRAASSDLYELRRRAFGAFREILARLSDTRPVVLVLDDVQWGDRDSADLLRNVLAPPDVPPLLLVATYRRGSHEGNELLRVLREPRAMDSAWEVVDVPIDPLPADDAIDLASRLLTDAKARGFSSRALAEEGAGSPLLIAELVRAAARREDGSHAVSMHDVVALRRSRLSEDATGVLELIAASDGPLTLTTVRGATGRDEAELARELELLREEHLVSVTVTRYGTEYEIFHDRIRQTIVGWLSRERLQELHAALARALQDRGAEPEVLFHHYLQASLNEQAAYWAEQAGDRAATGAAFEQASDLYSVAVTLQESRGAVDIPVRRKLARSLAQAGRGADAAAHYQALAEAGPPDAGVMRRRAGEQLLRAGRLKEGLRILGDAAKMAGLPFPKTPNMALVSLLWRRAALKLRGLDFVERSAAQIDEEALRAMDLCWALGNGLVGIDVVRSAHYHALCLSLALDAGEPRRIARSMALQAALAALESIEAADRVEPILAKAEQMAHELDEPHAKGWVLCGKAIQAWTRTDLERCAEHCEQAVWHLRERSEETFREIGSIEVWFHLHALFLMGRLDRVAARAPACVREAETRGDRYTMSTALAYVLPLHWAALDKPEQGRGDADRAISVWPANVWYHQHWAHLRAHCFLDLYEGQGDRIVERIRQARPRMKTAMHLRLRTPRLEVNYLEGRGALASVFRQPDTPERKQLLKLVKKRVRDLDAENAGLATAYARTLDAGLAVLERPESADEAFSSLAALYERLGMPLHAAAARCRRATVSGAGDFCQIAHEELVERGVVAPARFIDLLLPQVSR